MQSTKYREAMLVQMDISNEFAVTGLDFNEEIL
jgi:hypothetical protein